MAMLASGVEKGLQTVPSRFETPKRQKKKKEKAIINE